jgi:2-polyprenyl-3-methyl-5-hydroxy-6-metoxy-1,4-benzoquinol methylase
MSIDCVIFLQNVLKIRAFQSDEPAAAVANLNERFDVVVLWHCLEHFPRPWEVIQQITRVLQLGGVLLVALPNIESYEFGVLKSRWTHIDAPRHLHFYPLTSLTALCEANGLRCVEATTSDQLSRMLRRSSWHAWGKGLVPWSSFIGRILGVILGRSSQFFVGSAGRHEGEERVVWMKG